jgi:glycosyltransferase A (GT-A) superfamily protein (DUF2064 family)
MCKHNIHHTRVVDRNESNASRTATYVSYLLLVLLILQQEALKEVRKILYYAPANEMGLAIMKGLLQELQLPELSPPTRQSRSAIPNSSSNSGWILLPMISADLTATNLGDILTDILKQTRALPLVVQGQQHGTVVFLGMDSPELPVEEIVASLSAREALLCPANDGGYGMLSVPLQAPADKIFQGIRWSNPLTALAQIKALTDANLAIRLGRLMYDIDEPEDVAALCQRLAAKHETTTNHKEDDVLLKSSSSSILTITGDCRHTRQILQELNLL